MTALEIVRVRIAFDWGELFLAYCDLRQCQAVLQRALLSLIGTAFRGAINDLRLRLTLIDNVMTDAQPKLRQLKHEHTVLLRVLTL